MLLILILVPPVLAFARYDLESDASIKNPKCLYDSKYTLDIDRLLTSEKDMYNYVDCFLDRIPCGEREGEFKEILPEIFKQACGRCTTVQKQNWRRLIEDMKQHWPYDFYQLLQKYDPERRYNKILMRYLNKA